MQTKFAVATATVALLTVFSSAAVGQNGFLMDGTHHADAGELPAPIRWSSASSSQRMASDPGRVAFQFRSAQASDLTRSASPVGHVQYTQPKGKDGCKASGCAGGLCCETYNLRAYGEYLYLRARNVEVPYAVESNLSAPSRDKPPIQTSPIALVDQDFSSGFRAGFALVLDDCTELAATYSLFESSADHQISRDPTRPVLQILPMVGHPSTQTGTTGTAEASADARIDFDLIDLDLRRVLARSCQADLIGSVGVRYGRLEQGFAARFFNEPAPEPINAATVMTNIDFEGIGLKLGLDGDYYATRLPVMGYMKGAVSLLAGEFDAIYQQTALNEVAPNVDTDWSAGRIVPTFDLEIGGGFYSPKGRFLATAGYCYSVWTNMVRTDDWIHGVQQNMFQNMDNPITFDGLVLRVEGRF